MKRFALFHQVLIGGILLCSLLAIAGFFLFGSSVAAPVTPTPSIEPNRAAVQSIEQAIQAAIDLQAQNVPVFQLYKNKVERVTLSADGAWATAWMTPEDPDTGEVVPTEPGLVIAHLVNGNWQVFLPSDPGWIEAMRTAPDDLISPVQKQAWEQMVTLQAQAAPAAPLTGYRLPFPGGDTRRLTQSIGHDRYTPSGSAHFSFDFATAYPSAMFQVVAAKGGIVSRVRWTQANGTEMEPGNYIVLEDTSTLPTTYQLYLHFAQDSIPPELRNIGTPVRRGQYLGMADDTGISSGHHLHFMVHTTSTSYWGTSVDINFEDVSINGGRPRISSDLALCKSTDICSSTQNDYLSQNLLNPDPNPPIGGLQEPQSGAQIRSSPLHMVGYANDDSSGLYSAQFQANYDGTWKPIGSIFNTNWFSLDWDLCAAGVPDGPISLALQIRDKAFNQASGLPGLTQVVKNFTCAPPPPKCTPTASQVALWTDKDFQGDCVVLGIGTFSGATGLGEVGDDGTASIQVGANVKATLFTNTNKLGRAETFTANDSNLSDNRVGKNTVSSVWVQYRTATSTPPAPVWPVAGATLAADGPVSLSWNDTSGGMQYQAHILLNNVEVISTPWQNEPYWHISGLTPGNYTWQVKGRTGNTTSNWSAARGFSISSGDATPGLPAVAVPYEDPMETDGNWTAKDGWTLTTDANHTDPGGLKSWKYPSGGTYDTGSPNAGYLTSPPIAIPAGGVNFLRFWYQYESESSEMHWDQRWVQVSVDGGPFTNLLQLYDDPPNFWLRSPAILLQAYSGKTIRVRFYFVTLDANFNAFKGWHIDDFSVNATPPPDCGDADGQPVMANLLLYGSTTAGVICPGGDIDYYKFQGAAGDVIGAWTEAQSKGSPLDTYLSLLDTDGRSVLVKNDDMLQYQRTDSWITYRLPRDGAYYLKVQSWEQPTKGDLNEIYTLHLAVDGQDPTAVFTYPNPSGRISRTPVKLNVTAGDQQSGVSHVRFQWHSNDWLGGQWITLGDDWDGSDGWSYNFDASNAAGLYGGAVYARVYDWAGNWLGVAVWQLNQPALYLPFITK